MSTVDPEGEGDVSILGSPESSEVWDRVLGTPGRPGGQEAQERCVRQAMGTQVSEERGRDSWECRPGLTLKLMVLSKAGVIHEVLLGL